MASIVVSSKEQTQQVAFDVAHHYLQTVKLWKPEEYQLEAAVTEEDGEVLTVVMDGIFVSDLDALQREGGQSVQLYIDVQNRRVLRELAYQ